MKPLENIRVEYMAPGHMRVFATVYGKGEKPLPMYADKTVLGERVDVEREALHACMDLLGHRYGDGLHGPWQKVYWAFQGDIRRQIRAALR